MIRRNFLKAISGLLASSLAGVWSLVPRGPALASAAPASPVRGIVGATVNGRDAAMAVLARYDLVLDCRFVDFPGMVLRDGQMVRRCTFEMSPEAGYGVWCPRDSTGRIDECVVNGNGHCTGFIFDGNCHPGNTSRNCSIGFKWSWGSG